MDALWLDPASTLTKWKTPLMQDEEIVELPVDQRTVTRRYTQKAIDFITSHQEDPFFVYLPHSMPHIPLYVPDDVRDPDPKRAYINTIEHIDHEVGRLLAAIDDLNLAKNTYVIYATDNGPWLPFRHHGGSAGPLRDGKGTTFEGGQRVPCLIRGPGIPAGSLCDELTGTIDVLPTIAALTGTLDVLPTIKPLTGKALPKARRIDGLDVSGLWTGRQATSPRNEFLYYTSQGQLEGLRQGDWKLLIKKPRQRRNQQTAAETVLLFNLSEDLGEKTNLAESNPEIVARLTQRMRELDAEIEQHARSPWMKP